MSESNGFTSGQVALAFVAGAAVGAAVALLVAPQSGAATRAQLREAARRSRDKARGVPDAVQGALTAARGAFNEALAKAEHASDEA